MCNNFVRFTHLTYSQLRRCTHRFARYNRTRKRTYDEGKLWVIAIFFRLVMEGCCGKFEKMVNIREKRSSKARFVETLYRKSLRGHAKVREIVAISAVRIAWLIVRVQNEWQSYRRWTIYYVEYPRRLVIALTFKKVYQLLLMIGDSHRWLSLYINQDFPFFFHVSFFARTCGVEKEGLWRK